MVKNVILFMPPKSQYEVLQQFTTDFAKGLKNVEINVTTLEAISNDPGPFLESLFNAKPDFTLSFNGLLPDESGHFFSDMIQVPHVAYLIDSPNAFFSLIKSLFTVVACVDRFACEFFVGLGVDKVLFLPHGVDKDLKPDSSLERKHDVLLLSSCIDYEALRASWKGKYSPELCHALDEAAEMTLSVQDLPYVKALVTVLDKQKNFDPRKLDYQEVLTDLEMFIRGKDKIEMLRSIKDAKVDIYGSELDGASWKKYLGNHNKNIVYHSAVPFLEAQKLMKQSKIVLNSCPWIKDGLHERVLAAFACGALPLAADNPYMRSFFTNNQNILYYSYGQWSQINDHINHYLENESDRENVAEEGRKIVMNNHTWDHRAKELKSEIPKYIETILAKKKG